MSTQTANRVGVYEVMFLASQGVASQFGDLITHINELFGRADATVLAMRKWDERRLAYEIDKQKRGVYILAYISCPTENVAKLERDVQISERLLRAMVTKADHLTDEEIKSQDARQALADEAKFRAERAESGEEENAGRARLGAPEAVEAADADTASDED